MTNKLAIIGGSGLYDVEDFKDREFLDIKTPWGTPSDQILKTKFNKKEVFFLPRHGKGHFISPSKINFRANIDALKQLGVTDIVSVSAVGSLKEDLPPGKFFVVGTASLGTVGVTWSVPIQLKAGTNKLSLTLANAAWSL